MRESHDPKPIFRKDGRAVATLADARLMVELPKVRTGATYRQFAAELLLAATESGKRDDIEGHGRRARLAVRAQTILTLS